MEVKGALRKSVRRFGDDLKAGRLTVSRNRAARALLLHLILLPIVMPALAQRQSSPALELKSRINLPNVIGRIDHFGVDIQGQRLFVAAFDNHTVEVIANDYSVPTAYGHRQVLVKGYVHDVTICCGSEVIARHPRSYEREELIFDPLHYLALLEQKTALDQAAPLAGWQLPECFLQLRRLLEARLKKHGSREYVQVLRLMETFSIEEVTRAVEDALHLGTVGFDAVKHLLLCRIERRPPRLDMENYPHLPMAQVRTTQAADYMTLLQEATA
jgi:hypothetical protein